MESNDDISIRSIIIQVVVFTVVVVAGVAIAGQVLREPLEQLANWVVHTFGLLGVFVAVIATDAFTFPVPPDTYLFIAVASDAAVVPLLAVCCFASILAGNMAYQIGPYLRRIRFVSERLERFRPKGERLFLRYGAWTVAIAALTPVPFSVTCWFAGIYQMPRLTFFLATFARIPRLIGYYGLFLLGWAPPLT